MPPPTDSQPNKPVILLAFANDRTEGGEYLRNLPIEMDGIRTALQKARQAGLCELEVYSNTTVENILNVFQANQDRIAIFHYGGHADSYELLLESPAGEHAIAHSEGLVSFLAKQKGLQLVFLNGCCSQQQAEDLIAAGLPAVVGTSQKIDDGIATSLSERFYKGLAAGLSIDRAWAEAVDQIKVEKGTSNTRALHRKGNVEASDRFPWEIYYRKGAEVVKEWNLPDAVADPLFGLPEIPKINDLPETPFLFLKRYEREHARIFFGRSYDIRKLYNRIRDDKSDPLILLYGQSGVGKSSLFDAGLNPRLETDYTVIYARRIQEKGLAGTLAFALRDKLAKLGASVAPPAPMPVASLPDPSASAKNATRQQAIGQLQAAAQNLDEQTVRREIEALIHRLQNLSSETDAASLPSSPAPATDAPQDDDSPFKLLTQWRQLEARTGKPLLVILDQVEELYTRPNPQQPKELDEFLTALQSVFGSPTERPKGKLLLGYRKEYHPEIEEACKEKRLPRAKVFLESLGKKDILDIFHGLTRTPALKARYNLTVEDELPVMLADDLLEDKNSPVAPVLQIVLTKLWKAAILETPTAPRFTVAQYEKLKKDGIAMGEFFAQQMEQLRAWQPEVVDSGLALDILHFHITAMDTAGARSREELRQTYQHRQDVLDDLIAKCKEFYLLTEAPQSAEHTGLTHDTLAPAVAKEYNSSGRPGQRARRILENKRTDLEKDNPVTLDEADIELVEAGKNGTRQMTAKEVDLLERSKEKAQKRRRELEEALEKALEKTREAEAEKVRALRSLFSSLNVNMINGYPGSVCVRPSCARAPVGDGGDWIPISRLPQDMPSFEVPIQGQIEKGLVVREVPEREESRDFIVARQYFAGHVLVYAQDGLTKDEEIKTGSDNLLFAENALRWLAPSRAGAGRPDGATILLWQGTYAQASHLVKVGKFIERRGWSFEVATPETLEADLRRASILWYLSDWSPPADFASKHVPLIERFVRDGGGLLVGGLGWSYAQEGPPQPYAANELGKPFGFAFTADAFEVDRKKPIRLLTGADP